MSWSDVADASQTSWDTVSRAVEAAIEWGMRHVDMTTITAIGVDEIHWPRTENASSGSAKTARKSRSTRSSDGLARSALRRRGTAALTCGSPTTGSRQRSDLRWRRQWSQQQSENDNKKRPSASGHTKALESRTIMRLAIYPSQGSPTDFAEEANFTGHGTAHRFAINVVH